MEITSFYYLCFFGIVLLVYYLAPVRFQWTVLLTAGVIYYLLAGNGMLILFPWITSIVAYASARRIAACDTSPKRTMYLIGALCILFGILIALKYTKLIGSGWVLPLGLSFYTFILAGYIIDVYNEIIEADRNPCKVMLYGFFFPVLISGPIFSVREMRERFFTPHHLSYRNLTFGLQRMLWGFFQKLVISERLAVIVAEIYDNPELYTGPYIWFGTVAFAFRLYTDFSGCMDIVIGLSETLGIVLPENFNIPFLSKDISEYWRRWHITLGTWMKDHVFYPLLRSSLFRKTGTVLRNRFGKKKGGRYNNYIAMMILWSAVGLWHGGELKYLIGSGLLHCFYIIIGEVSLPFWKKLFNAINIPMTGRFADAVRVARTFFLVNIGFVFFRADSTSQALIMLRNALRRESRCPSSIFFERIAEGGLDWIQMTILVVSLLLFVLISAYRYKHAEQNSAQHVLRERIASLPIFLRWGLWLALLFYVILLGQYGPGYNATEFIYQGF